MGLSAISPAGRPDEGHASRGGRPGETIASWWCPAPAHDTRRVLEIEHQALHRDEHAARILFGELVVEAAQNLVRVGDVPGERAQDASRRRP